MKRFLLVLVLLLSAFIVNAQESGYDQFLSKYIDTSIVVYISNDTVVHCTLIKIYNDGILVKPILKQMTFISKDHILMIETKLKL